MSKNSIPQDQAHYPIVDEHHTQTRLIVERRSARIGPRLSGVGQPDPVLGFLALVYEEIQRARSKFPNPELSALALSEEVGELAKALLDESSARVVSEAVQVAVMAARVALEGDLSVNDYRSRQGVESHPARSEVTP